MKQITLTQGKVARVSDHRFDYLNQWKWQAVLVDNVWYAQRAEEQPHPRTIYMHREIAGAPQGTRVDHRDCDGLNNVDENLRVCTASQNAANRKMNINNSTGFKGVIPTGNQKKNPYKAEIRFHRQKIYLGSFPTAEEAARAYDEKAKELFGEFARTNF